MNSERFELPSGVPLTRNIRTAYAGDQPVEVMDTISNGEAVSYRFEIQVWAQPQSGGGMNSPPTTAALTLSLTGPYERQGTEAAEGVRLWAELAGIRLTLVDDRGSKAAAARAYAAWLNSMDLLIGPYASGLVRAVAPLVRDAGRLLWNHGGSADEPGAAGSRFPSRSCLLVLRWRRGRSRRPPDRPAGCCRAPHAVRPSRR